jgi:hypothetical protein
MARLPAGQAGIKSVSAAGGPGSLDSRLPELGLVWGGRAAVPIGARMNEGEARAQVSPYTVYGRGTGGRLPEPGPGPTVG